MEVRGILQTIGMEASVLTFLFVMGFAAVRICVAERKAQRENEDSYPVMSADRHML